MENKTRSKGELIMKRRITAALLGLCLTLSVFMSGCNISINLNGSSSSSDTGNKSSTVSASASSNKSGNAGSASASSQAEDAEYTMADIAKLKNTDNFAKKTLEHIFDGTINSKGKATGYHYTRVSDSKGEVISGTQSEKDEHGVFTGDVKVSGVKKNGFSSFYPEEWSPQQVVDAINEAYTDALRDPDNPHGSLWIRHCGDLEIDMYLDNNKKITTAFPIYEGD